MPLRSLKSFEAVRPPQHLTSSLALYDELQLDGAQAAAIFLVEDEVRVNIAEPLVLLANPLLFASNAGVGVAALQLFALAAFAVTQGAGSIKPRHFEEAGRRSSDVVVGSCWVGAL